MTTTNSSTAGPDAAGFPCDTSLHIRGPAGMLEGLTQCPSAPGRLSAVVCHPHPLYGGTLHNKVVHILARTLVELGARAVRFNFRGVGASEGAFAHGVGETEDVLAVLEWVRARRPDDEIWLAGFSFGAYMALRAAARFPVAQLALVAPPVHLYPELGPPPPPRAPTLVLQGEQDDVVPAADVTAWVESLSNRPLLRLFPDTGHYFHGRLNDLRAAMEETLRSRVPA